jgi:hypothetical protein
MFIVITHYNLILNIYELFNIDMLQNDIAIKLCIKRTELISFSHSLNSIKTFFCFPNLD